MAPDHVRGAVAAELPTEIYFEVTNRCNLRCGTCPQSWGMPEPSADLSPDQVAKLLAQLPTVRRVVLHGIGEPTLNPDLPDIVRVVKQHGAYALFNSNGLALSKRLAAELVASGVDEIRVSVDAATPETYRHVRGADAFGKILRNLGGVREAKDAAGVVTPRLSLWMTGLKSNIRELPDLVRLAASAGIAEVYVQRLVFSGRGLADEREALYGRIEAVEASAIRAAEDLAAALGITLRGSSEALPPETTTGGDAPWRACRRPWSLMYVTANGTSLPCCISPFTDSRYDDLVLGNAFVTPLEEIWNGAQYRAWRERMLAGEPPRACSGCGSAWAL